MTNKGVRVYSKTWYFHELQWHSDTEWIWILISIKLKAPIDHHDYSLVQCQENNYQFLKYIINWTALPKSRASWTFVLPMSQYMYTTLRYLQPHTYSLCVSNQIFSSPSTYQVSKQIKSRKTSGTTWGSNPWPTKH